MKIGEPPSEPLLAPRATCTILLLKRSGTSDCSGNRVVAVVGPCGIVVVASLIGGRSEDLVRSRKRPHWLTYMASLFRCQGAAVEHAPTSGRVPHGGPVRRTHSAARPDPLRAPGWAGD